MTHLISRGLLVCALASFCVAGIAAEKTSSRSKKSTAAKTTTASSKTATKKPAFKGRLPKYFTTLVDEEQREEIYEIQASYRDEIEELEKQLAELKTAEMAAMEKVLTTTQRKQLADMREGKVTKTASGKSSSSKSGTSAESASTKSSSSKSSSRRSSKSKPASSKSSSSSKKTTTKK